MKICTCTLAWGILVGSALCGCTNGPIPLSFTLSGYGGTATATVIIPQQPPKVVPVVKSSVLEAPALLVPTGTLPNYNTDTVTVAANAKVESGQTVKIVEAPVFQPTLAVPSK